MVRKLFLNSWWLFKLVAISALLMLVVFALDKNVEVESILIYFLMFRLAIYTLVIWGLPLYICHKLNIDKKKLLNNTKTKQQLIKVRIYLTALFVIIEALMIYRGVWI
ncbi:MAG: hypothetical protein P8I03_14890 [Thalassotalea sp.]|nr:hypothetical protein [Thalassotalea sp.]